ncbi:hypothetical protein C8F01DRAFT_626873 [Mycena amicta]|nr:hypothetical protein C8F01DRAFT_626873 [Mycena amicta]
MAAAPPPHAALSRSLLFSKGLCKVCAFRPTEMFLSCSITWHCNKSQSSGSGSPPALSAPSRARSTSALHTFLPPSLQFLTHPHTSRLHLHFTPGQKKRLLKKTLYIPYRIPYSHEKCIINVRRCSIYHLSIYSCPMPVSVSISCVYYLLYLLYLRAYRAYKKRKACFLESSKREKNMR